MPDFSNDCFTLTNLQPFHTFGLSAHCSALNLLETPEQIPLLEPEAPFWLLGEGSNCIFVEDFAGEVWVNRLSGIAVEERDNCFKIRVASGEHWHSFVKYCLNAGIYGFENLALIPGTIGAAPIQNIGAYGREVAEFIDSVEVIDLLTGELFVLQAKECQFGYRDSIFKRPEHKFWFIRHVSFTVDKHLPMALDYGELRQLENPTPKTIFETVVNVRQRKLPDPAELGNAGSFFKNPVITKEQFARIADQYAQVPHFAAGDNAVKIPAAWLIDQCGFKGRSLGGVQSHVNQPLVLVNTGNAQGKDVVAFARQIQSDVHARFGVRLENEVRLVGKLGDIQL
ncbi:UDP-N-acetylmuramate dehydrogenase [Alteromonas facilis]|uniref:UDP-N-acetylmuramate dehydrogenase n=1 Tax=Alteromonas facilis TaxID=2048004 RepID=UPI001F0C1137|nr:UDP-N-acetylmuramate dehydrogenase [Alteromonas facilis]